MRVREKCRFHSDSAWRTRIMAGGLQLPARRRHLLILPVVGPSAVDRSRSPRIRSRSSVLAAAPPGGRASGDVHDMGLDPLPHVAVQGAPDRRQQQQGADGIGEETRESAAARRRPPGTGPSNTSTTGSDPSASCRCARSITLMPCQPQHPDADHRREHDQRQRRPEPDPAADLDEQRDLEERHADQRSQQEEAEPWADRRFVFACA